ncbi:SagB family peptide dehydrogenase [Alicyclobacillus macrosporangiidus]|uniref:SagB-type dehydrogenase domain-containing protein n=1 Tax=Alicyclobacillus macrosporangiidus TaxID=392015 RepID=A0A1I7JV35_9BACL|nr:SagB family peptide dehydrogenase [Alicyclobacillus macrosporangiidus]SFU89028.1 SagB-type dehydrogenase domain-containing protein [Alicyclobacillus macrosporangiidus]
MNLEAFLHDLHFDVDKVRPPDWIPDWSDAPLPYKLYRGLPTVPLPASVPLTLEAPPVVPATPDLTHIGHLLWYVYGIHRLSQTSLSLEAAASGTGPAYVQRRFLPSGGALYPNELYVYLRLPEAPWGIYHYDAAHHRLVLLREGRFDPYLRRTLADRIDVSACFATVFVSTVFWNGFFKYADFAYRLQAVDSGVAVGQVLEVARRFGYTAGVCFQFLDRAVNHLLGLSDADESVYAVVPLSVHPVARWVRNPDDEPGEDVSDADLLDEVDPVRHDHHVGSSRVLACPRIVAINRASQLTSTRMFRRLTRSTRVPPPEPAVRLPAAERLSFDFAAACKRRRSPGADFVLQAVPVLSLASLLAEGAAPAGDWREFDGGPGHPDSLELYVCTYGVDGVPDGAYRYDAQAHVLQGIRPGDHRPVLQRALSMPNLNLFQVPVCVHVVGRRDHLVTSLGLRGYRIQQMQAGIMLHRLLLVAAAMGWNGHPLLGFEAPLCDDLYDLPARGQTALVQVPIGPHRPGPRWEGALHG